MTVAASKALRSLALATVVAVGLVAVARADSPLAVRLGSYWNTDHQSRMLMDNKGLDIGLQYTLSGVPAILNGESWSTSVSVDYCTRFTSGRDIEVHAIPVSINQVYTFEEQNGKTPYAGFCLTAVTYKSELITPNQPWVTRIGGGLILGLNLSDKMFIEGRYEMFDKGGAVATPDGFRAVLGYRL